MTTKSSQAEPAPPNRSREFTVDALTVQVHGEPAALAEAAATTAARHLQEVWARQSIASVILATGQSQLQFLERFLIQPGMDWKRVVFYHMDEYLGLPEDHPASFRRYLQERVDRRVKSAAFHYLGGDALEPAAECDRYARLLGALPIDLCLLGIGDNGHLAFNDPAVANFDDPYPVKIVKLDEICRQQQVNQGHFPGMDAVPAYALTLSIPTLCSAQRLLCLAPGAHKATIVKTMLSGPIEPACPASILRRQPQATLMLDEESARFLA